MFVLRIQKSSSHRTLARKSSMRCSLNPIAVSGVNHWIIVISQAPA